MDSVLVVDVASFQVIRSLLVIEHAAHDDGLTTPHRRFEKRGSPLGDRDAAEPGWHRVEGNACFLQWPGVGEFGDGVSKGTRPVLPISGEGSVSIVNPTPICKSFIVREIASVTATAARDAAESSEAESLASKSEGERTSDGIRCRVHVGSAACLLGSALRAMRATWRLT